MLHVHAPSDYHCSVLGIFDPANSTADARDVFHREILDYSVNLALVPFEGIFQGINIQRQSESYLYGMAPSPVSAVGARSTGWSGFVSNAHALFTDWHFQKVVNHETEHPVSHWNIRGDVQDDAVGLFSDSLVPMGPYGSEVSHARGFTATCNDIPIISLDGWQANPGKGSLYHTLPTLVVGGTWPNLAYKACSGTFCIAPRAVEQNVEDDLVVNVVFARHTWFNASGGLRRHVIEAIRMSYWYTTSPVVCTADYTDLDDVIQCFVTTEKAPLFDQSIPSANDPWASVEASYLALPRLAGIGVSPWANAYTISGISAFGARPHRGVRAYLGWDGENFINSHVRSYRSFRDTVSMYLRDAYPLAFLSTNDAIDTHLASLDLNALEHFSEVREVGGLVGFWRLQQTIEILLRNTSPLARRVNRRFRGLSLALKLLSILADAELLWAFALSPTLDDAKHIAEKGADTLRRLKESPLTHEATIYGKYDLDCPLGDFPDMHVTARSKIRVKLNPDSFLAMLVPIEQLGLLPRLSKLWETIPFSFVVDKFFDVGLGIDITERHFAVLALDVKLSLHSVTFSTEFSEDDQNDYLFVDQTLPTESGFIPSGYRFYDRWVADYLPAFGATRLPVLYPSSPIDWGTTTSLLYKLIVG